MLQLIENNYKNWKSDMELALGLANLDLALIKDKPPHPIKENITKQKAHYKKWERANRLSIMVMKKSISLSFKVNVFDENNAKKFFKAIR